MHGAKIASSTMMRQMVMPTMKKALFPIRRSNSRFDIFPPPYFSPILGSTSVYSRSTSRFTRIKIPEDTSRHAWSSG